MEQGGGNVPGGGQSGEIWTVPLWEDWQIYHKPDCEHAPGNACFNKTETRVLGGTRICRNKKWRRRQDHRRECEGKLWCRGLNQLDLHQNQHCVEAASPSRQDWRSSSSRLPKQTIFSLNATHHPHQKVRLRNGVQHVTRLHPNWVDHYPI